MKSTAKYGLENLNKTHEAFSLGFATTQKLRSTIKTPDAIAVYRYTSCINGSPLS
jgi:hypothetical protein